MHIHHLNCGTMCPRGGALTVGSGRDGRLVCHCLLIETRRGLVLVDTGLGLNDITTPGARINPLFRALLAPRLTPEETAEAQVRELGFATHDVRHIILTHLDFDHAGGLDDFPWASVHVYAPEAEAARHRRSLVARGRYRPQQWRAFDHWRRYQAGGEPWFGFACVRQLDDVPPDILLVPLIGHTRGHCGVAVRGSGGWLLHAGDAYFCRSELDPLAPRCPAGLAGYQTMMEVDRRARLANQQRLRELAQAHGSEVRIVCAHDVREFEACVREPRVSAPAPLEV